MNAYLGILLAGDTNVVEKVQPGSPADTDGLMAGDVIVEAVHREIRRRADLVDVFDSVEPGDPVLLEIMRSGTKKTMIVVANTREDS